jgi:hypothetical protein
MNTAAQSSTFRDSTTPDEPVRVDVRRHPAESPPPPPPALPLEQVRTAINDTLHADLATDVERVRQLANWLDAKFSLAGVRFGLDGLVGLIPGVGDTIMALVALYPLSVARRHRLGKWVQAKILGNIALDWVVGLVPLVGDLFDVGFKSNLRNLRVIERAAERRGVVPAMVEGVRVDASVPAGGR